MRLLIYSQDGLGLGHLRRTSNIARQILDLEPECKILVLGDSPVLPFVPRLPGVDHLKLPTIIKTGSGTWRPASLSLDISDIVKLRARVILETFCEFRPDVILVDHMPVGALGELKPMLNRAASAAKPPKMFLGLRDILDAPEATCRAWTEVQAYEHLRLYDAVLIFGCREMYDAESAYQLSQNAQRVAYCNYVTGEPDADRTIYPQSSPPPGEQPPDEPFLLVMGGGGHDMFSLARTFLESLPALLQRMRPRCVILTGPNMSVSDRHRLRAQSTSYPVQVLGGFEGSTSWLDKASVIVMMAGYNTLCEVMARRKKALVVPRAGPSAEQRMRSQLFAERRLVRALDPNILTPERLARELTRLLMEGGIPEAANIPPLDGARRAAALIMSESGGVHDAGASRTTTVTPKSEEVN